jgi:2-polyprenyl-6-methoxyphenol hydroxylase-like FAD-dependent oxidoreductase
MAGHVQRQAAGCSTSSGGTGLGRLDRQGLAAHAAEFRRFLTAQGRLPQGLPTRGRGHAYLLYEGRRPGLVDDGVLLVGDAAGLAYPASGEGIRPAVESGLLAAEVARAAQGRYARRDLEPYRRALRARFGGAGLGGSFPVPATLAAAAARRLFHTRWFTRRVVLDRWFLRRGTAAPARYAIRSLG